MISPLTIHIMTRNNESTIEKTIESVFNLNYKIIICDIGSKDNTVSLCNKYKLNPNNYKHNFHCCSALNFNGFFNPLREWISMMDYVIANPPYNRNILKN